MKTSRILFILLAVFMVQCETIPARLFEEIEKEKEIENSVLTEQKINSLMHMREEEMLAYDVYTFLSGIYDVPIFRNIARSEMVHTTRVKELIDKYGLEDPAADHKPGEFNDAGLQELYDELIEKGKVSYKDAIVVGLTIEDLDINDLEMALEYEVDNEDIVEVYNFLLMGSKNHMKAFYFQAKSNNIEYIPQFISQEHFLEIVEAE
ncbi:MAG: DUF2202 domain-containing protein [Bacteroidales bacterium]|nr:DUF2202 domain-containing protein [Bacteroidales bacterium]